MTTFTSATSKRSTAINGDLVRLEHPTLDLSAPFTSHIDIAYDGITHQVLSMADRSAFNYATATGEFAVGELRGHVIETMDTVQAQVVHRYQAVIAGDAGVLAVVSYLSAADAVDLVGALGPVSTPLGMTIEPDNGAEVVGDPRIAVTTSLGVLEVSPLTTAIEAQLPHWQGTAVDHGQLYGGRIGEAVPWLTLVTETCRVVAMLGADVDPDDGATALAALNAVWTT